MTLPLTNKLSEIKAPETKKDDSVVKEKKPGRTLIHTYAIHKFKGFEIFIRRIGIKVWEYWIVIDGKLYTAHVIIKPKWWRIWLRDPYTYYETRGSLNLLQKMSETTIDTVLNKKQNAKQKTK